MRLSHSKPAPAAQTPDSLAALIDDMILLADDLLAHGSEGQQERVVSAIMHLAELAIAAEATPETARLKARAIRLIYAGHEPGMVEALREEALNGGSRVDTLALQVLALMALPQ
jgi:hypothetical protein